MLRDKISWTTRIIIDKFKDEYGIIAKCSKNGEDIESLILHFDDEYIGREIVNGNVALNEGLQELIDIITGVGGTAWDNTNAYIGIGDGTDAEDPTQTGLSGTNKTYIGMDTGYPMRSGQTAIWRATADGSTANHDWQEFTVCNSNDESTGKNLNRKVVNKGTKNAGETWVVSIEITFA